MRIFALNILRFIAALILVSTPLCISSFSADLTGTVKSQSGKPVPDVTVTSGGAAGGTTKTDARGFFKLTKHSRVVFFRHFDYRPLSKIVDQDATLLDVTLEDSIGSERPVASCSSAEDRRNRIGYDLKYLLPKGLKFKQVRDIDYVEWFVYDEKNKRDWLEIWYGPTVSSGFPSEDLLTSSRSFTERYRRSAMGRSVDVQGVSTNGTRWRYTRSPFGLATYKEASVEAAVLFDRIIDEACVDMTFLDKILDKK